MSVHEIRSISQVGTVEPFNLQVARGQIPGHKLQFKFGHNLAVSNTKETIWAEGGLYVYPTSATQMTVSSSSADDAAAGTGARTINIQGLDADYNEISEDIILNGQTPVTTVNSYLRINRGAVLTAGTGGKNAGIIRAGTGTVTSGVPANVFLSIDGDGDNQTLMCLWTVPAGYTAFMVQTNISTGNASQTPALLKATLVARPQGGVFNTKERITLKDGNHLQDYNFPLRFTEKTDLEVRAKSSSASVTFDCSASLEFIYIKNDSRL
jgi:hypothetical protein